MQDAYAAELGRVVALWSRLEHMMNGAICQISGIGLNLGDVFFNNISMPARFMILEGVAIRYLKDKEPKLCDALIKCASKIREYRKRNELVHGLWIRGVEAPTTQHPSRKEHERTNQSWTLKDMEAVGDDISTFIMEFWGLVEMMDELLPQAPSKHRPWRRKPPLRPPRALQRLWRSR
jgi:hypothetical protein